MGRRILLEKCTAFVPHDPPICAFSAFLREVGVIDIEMTAVVFSSICGKIDSIGEMAGISRDVRVLPEEPKVQQNK